MLLRRFYDEKLAQASYLVGCSATGEALVVDPVRDVAQYVEAADREGLRITNYGIEGWAILERPVLRRLVREFHAADVRGTLATLARGEATGRRDARERTVFKSVGTALEDLADTGGKPPLSVDQTGDLRHGRKRSTVQQIEVNSTVELARPQQPHLLLDPQTEVALVEPALRSDLRRRARHGRVERALLGRLRGDLVHRLFGARRSADGSGGGNRASPETRCRTPGLARGRTGAGARAAAEGSGCRAGLARPARDARRRLLPGRGLVRAARARPAGRAAPHRRTKSFRDRKIWHYGCSMSFASRRCGDDPASLQQDRRAAALSTGRP